MKQQRGRMDQQGRGKHAAPMRAPKDSVHLAFCISYVGSAFRGLQLQGHAPMHHTVEGIFVQALHQAGVLLKLEQGRIADANHFLGRSCRTDRGVHAMRNLVTLFIPTQRFQDLFHGSEKEVADAVNRSLPPPVQVVAVTRVMSTFSAKNNCNRRVYRYLLPAYAISDSKVDSWETYFKAFPDAATYCCSQSQHHNNNVSIDLTRPLPIDNGDQNHWMVALRDTVEALNRDVTAKFVGSRRFHNYTVDADQNGKMSAKTLSSLSDESLRLITRCEIAPRVYLLPSNEQGPSNAWLQETLVQELYSCCDASEEEKKQCEVAKNIMSRGPPASGITMLPYVVFQVEGASFLLNMIRKMVGVVIAVARGARPTIVEDSLSPANRTSNPLAPGPYLSLSLSSYSGYDVVARALMAKHALKEQAKVDVDAASTAARSECPNRSFGSYTPLEHSWNECFGAQEATAAFFRRALVPDVVDADLNRMVPLETSLYLRDAYRRHCNEGCKVQDQACDAHLPSMKEYIPSKPLAFPAAASEMTIFLRMLRVHNWNIRPVTIPPNSKVANEMNNQQAQALLSKCSETECVDSSSKKRLRDEVDGGGVAPSIRCSSNIDAVDTDVNGAPPNYDDGWIYVAPSEEETLQKRWSVIQARYFNTRKMRREWGLQRQQKQEHIHGVPTGDDDDETCLQLVADAAQVPDSVYGD